MIATNPNDVSIRRRSLAWLYTALVGALICGILGPALPLLVLVFRETSSFREVWAALYVFVMTWPLAVMFVGAPGVAFGTLAALWIRFRSKRFASRRLLLETLVLGPLLGAIVPLTTRVFGPSSREFLPYVTPIGAITGVICAFLTLFTLKKLGLLLASQAG